MKILILSITLSTSFLSETLTSLPTILLLPQGLEIGKTLRTDLDPMIVSRDGNSFFASSFDAHFDEMGFLEKLILDQSKDHEIPSTWNLNWNAKLSEVEAALATFGQVDIVKKDMSESPTAHAFTSVVLETEKYTYRFEVMEWKNSQKADGLSSIVVTASAPTN